PTTSQMLAIVRNQAAHDKILVVIAGGSLSWGFGQSPSRLWSDRLQENLGDSYAVVNLAMNGHGAFESGYVAFEKLRHEYKRAIFVTSGTPIIPLERTQLRIPRGAYLFYDALFKGYLDAFPERLRPPVAAKFRNKLFKGDQEQEAVFAGALDSVCRFQDLWTSVAYSYFSTIWTRQTRENIWRPRKEFADSHCDRWHKTTINRAIMKQAKHDVETYVRLTFYDKGRLRDPRL